MAAKEISVKKYVVRLSGEERERLETLLRKGKSPARRVLKARILLKADVSEAGKGWSDNRIIEALETSPSMVYRVRKQLVEEGFEAVLSRKPRAMPAVARIFDGEKDSRTAMCLGLVGGIFLPGVLILLGTLPFWDTFRRREGAQATMRGINAAVVGLLGAALYSPVWTSSVNAPGDFAVALVGFVLLTVWRAPPLLVVVVSALGGMVLLLANG